MLLERTKPVDAPEFRALTWPVGPALDDFVRVVREQSFAIPQASLDSTGWRLEGSAKRDLLAKLRAGGTPLGEYCKGRFYRGVLTGLNDAFVVDRATRDRLIAEHPSSAAVLKPYLRGRDVKRWKVESQDLWLITIASSENTKHPWSGKSLQDAEKAYAKALPAIHAFHQPFREALIARADQGKYFWELRSCAYWKEFEEPKIIVPAITDTVNYASDDEGFYSNDKTNVFIPPYIDFTLAILNSSVSMWITRQEFASKQGGFYEFKPMYVSKLPIPKATSQLQAELEKLTKQLIKLKSENAPASQMAALEADLDERVAHLFWLTPAEIALLGEAG